MKTPKTISKHPALRHLFPALAALSMAVYTYRAAGLMPGLAGIADTLAYTLLFVLVLWLLDKIRHGVLRGLLTAVALGLNLLFFFGNVLYQRFFGAWFRYDVITQIGDAGPVLSGLDTLTRTPDLVFLIALPVGLVLLSRLAERTPLGKKSSALLAGAILLCLTAQWATSKTSGSATEVNPMLDLPRQAIRALSIRHASKEEMDKSFANVRSALRRAPYESAGDAEYPWLVLPAPTITPPYDLKGRRPNVIFILLESVRAFESGLYNDFGVSYTPNLDRMARGGLFFTDFYANSSGTVNGEFSSLGSFYSSLGGEMLYAKHPELGILTMPELLGRRGYSTLWVSGYKATYGNKRGFWQTHGITNIVDNIASPKLKIGWGPSDEDIFAYAALKLKSMKEPFFAEVMTLSNHFDWSHAYPTAAHTPPSFGEPTYQNYTKGVYYTDYALGKFIEGIKAEPYYSNTVFVIVGDHGVSLYPSPEGMERTRVLEGFLRVPMVIYAPGLPEVAPRRIETPASQVDVAPTMLDLLGIYDANAFVGSSLLREHSEDEALVFIRSLGGWNLRLGNRYCYNVGMIGLSGKTEFIKTRTELDPANPDNTIEARLAERAQGAPDKECFRLREGDLLWKRSQGALEPLTAKERERMLRLGEDLYLTTSNTMARDRIYPAGR